jgi:hypothetical protein
MTRYHVGIVLHEGSFWDNLGETLTKKGYKIATLPASARSGAAIFPFTGMLSILLAVPFVSGRLGKYAETAGLAKDSCGSSDGQQVLGLCPTLLPPHCPNLPSRDFVQPRAVASPRHTTYSHVCCYCLLADGGHGGDSVGAQAVHPVFCNGHKRKRLFAWDARLLSVRKVPFKDGVMNQCVFTKPI